jgi:hypothetical protein
MGILKKLKRFIFLIAFHTQRVVSKYFIVWWSFKIFLPEADDNKYFLNDGRSTNFFKMYICIKNSERRQIFK